MKLVYVIKTSRIKLSSQVSPALNVNFINELKIKSKIVQPFLRYNMENPVDFSISVYKTSRFKFPSQVTFFSD